MSPAFPVFVQAIGVVVAALVSIYFWQHRVTAEKEIERSAELSRRADQVSDLLVPLPRTRLPQSDWTRTMMGPLVVFPAILTRTFHSTE